jgi:type III pantothenate kinase
MSERQLLIDAGNTRVKWQLWEGPVLRGQGALSLEAASTLPEGPGALFLSSVLRPGLESELLRAMEAQGWTLAYRAASAHAFPGLVPGYLEPARLGVDRWLALVALKARGRLPAVAVDAGSALTIDCLSPEGRHEGGWIVPGLTLAQRALFQGTDGVRGEGGWQWDASQAPPRHTAAAVAQGLLQQAMAFIAEAAQQGAMRWGPRPIIVLTGGDGEALLPGLRHRLPHHALELAPALVLEGLRALGEIHCGPSLDSLHSPSSPP